MTARPQAPVLIFDLDGTLFRGELVSIPATRGAFERHGLEPPGDDEIRSFIGKPASEYDAWLARRCPPRLAAEIVREAAEQEIERIGTEGALYAGAAEALRSLRADAGVLALCSNGSMDYVEAVTQTHGIAGFFDHVRYRTPADRGKSQMVADLLRRIGTGPAGAVIGDRIDDVRAARDNGVLAVGCAYGYGRNGELDGADAVVTRPADLPAAVRRLLSA